MREVYEHKCMALTHRSIIILSQVKGNRFSFLSKHHISSILKHTFFFWFTFGFLTTPQGQLSMDVPTEYMSFFHPLKTGIELRMS